MGVEFTWIYTMVQENGCAQVKADLHQVVGKRDPIAEGGNRLHHCHLGQSPSSSGHPNQTKVSPSPPHADSYNTQSAVTAVYDQIEANNKPTVEDEKWDRVQPAGTLTVPCTPILHRLR